MLNTTAVSVTLRDHRRLLIPKIFVLIMATYFLQSILIPLALPLNIIQASQTIAWAITALLAFRIIGSSGLLTENTQKVRSMFDGLVLSLVFVIAYYVIGVLVGGIGFNPLNYSPKAFLVNLLWITLSSVTIELLRIPLLAVTRKKTLAVLLSGIGFSLLMIPLAVLLGIDAVSSAGRLLASKSPLISLLLLSGMVGIVFGFKSAILFLTITRSILFLAPILPNIAWAETALVSVLALLATYYVAGFISGGFRGHFSGGTGVSVPLLIILLIGIWLSNGVLGYRMVVVTSGSMTPTLNIGDIAVIKEEPASDIHVGDVVLYWGDQGLILHRLHSIGQEHGSTVFITKGDANPDVDPWVVTGKDIVGKQVAKIPWLGKISIYIRTTLLELFK